MIDRRVQKTLQALHEALISLIQEKGFDATTVKDITARAKVGRSTFYAHYLDKESLLQGGLDDFGKILLAKQRDMLATNRAPAGLACSHAVFAHALGYRIVYRAMLGKSAGVVVADRLRKVLRIVITADLAARPPIEHRDDVPLAARIEFLVGAIMSLLTWWVDAADEYSVDDMDAIFRRLTNTAIA
jgi:AcrR family transcriptional regulator